MVLSGSVWEIWNIYSDYQKGAKFRQENDFLWQKTIKPPRKIKKMYIYRKGIKILGKNNS